MVVEVKGLQARLTDFVNYRKNHLKGDEKGEAQVFLDRLFQAFGHAGVVEAGGTLETRVSKRSNGGTAFADLVWRPRLLVEMKKANQPLGKHYQQAFEYWIDLVPNRPEYVVLCNFDEFWIYDLNKQLDDPMDRVALDDLPKRWEALSFLLPHPEAPIFGNDLVQVTREAAATVARVTNSLISRGLDRSTAQRFTMQCVVSMFAEDAGLLPAHSFTRALEASIESKSAYDILFGLFGAMDTQGVTPAGRYEGVPYFNGGLFRKSEPIELTMEEMVALHHASTADDWTAVRPEIFGTLFEQSLGKDERHAFGAHFTSGADIQRIVLPTIVRPWRERIEAADSQKALGVVEEELLKFRVLDPACGCGNFLYVAYREIRKLEKDIHDRQRQLSKAKRADTAQMSFVRPAQFFGMDINSFAVEIAKVTLMLGKQLAATELGDEHAVLPLDDLDKNFHVGDALFMDWPKFDACIGNPPYLGRRRVIEERGASYSAELAHAYPDIGGVSDYVVYWFRKAHDLLPTGGRAGLVGTNSIRETSSRAASLDYIIDNEGIITDAWSSLKWSGEANVHVSIANWVKGPTTEERILWLDEGNRRVALPEISGSLRESFDLRTAIDLRANVTPKCSFQGQTAGHTKGFVINRDERSTLIEKDALSAAVIHPYIVGDELLNKSGPGRWIIDLDAGDAMGARRQSPGAYARVRSVVLPDRQRKAEKEESANAKALEGNPSARVNRHHQNFLNRWWQLSYRREDFLAAVAKLDRYIVTSRVASEQRPPVFLFVSLDVRPSDAIQAFALDDDYSMGILQSRLHEAWFRQRCSHLKSDLRYTSTTVFDSFPWPQDPTAGQVAAVVKAAGTLVEFRAQRLSEGITLANQYNSLGEPGRNPLRDLQDGLDAAVVAAYGFGGKLDPLVQLLTLNHECAAREAAGLPVRGPGGREFADVRRTSWVFC